MKREYPIKGEWIMRMNILARHIHPFTPIHSRLLHQYINMNSLVSHHPQFVNIHPPLILPIHSSIPPSFRCFLSNQMALKAVHVSDVPNIGRVPETASISRSSSLLSKGMDLSRASSPKFLVIGHRGNGMNLLQPTDLRMNSIRENTILSFNTAGNYPIDFIEFDVQVTKDGCPVIFHDNFILTEDNGEIHEQRMTDLSLSEFLSYGPQKQSGVTGKPLLRKMKDGNIVKWKVESDDHLCTLEEAFEKVNPSLGFNIELKFDDNVVYQPDYLVTVLQSILQVVSGQAKGRPVLFSSFQPDAALLVRKLQSTHPVFFLTNGGNEIYSDVRRNSLEKAIEVCLQGGLQGIVCEVRSIFRNPGSVSKIKDSKLSLLTYGKLNNVGEAVSLQHLMGVEGVIVDSVGEITEYVSKMLNSGEEDENDEQVSSGGSRPQFSKKDLGFLLKLIPHLIQQ